jgi:hypothetical protein
MVKTASRSLNLPCPRSIAFSVADWQACAKENVGKKPPFQMKKRKKPYNIQLDNKQLSIRAFQTHVFFSRRSFEGHERSEGEEEKRIREV